MYVFLFESWGLTNYKLNKHEKDQDKLLNDLIKKIIALDILSGK